MEALLYEPNAYILHDWCSVLLQGAFRCFLWLFREEVREALYLSFFNIYCWFSYYSESPKNMPSCMGIKRQKFQINPKVGQVLKSIYVEDYHCGTISYKNLLTNHCNSSDFKSPPHSSWMHIEVVSPEIISNASSFLFINSCRELRWF